MSKYKTLYDREQEEKKKRNYKKYRGDIHRGDIFYFDKGYTVGVEQQGGRPGIIVSNDACNNSSEFLLVCYLTTQPKTDLPTHVPIVCEQSSICLCEQIHTLSKEKMQTYYCTATPEEMAEIDKALVTTLDIDIKNVLPEEYDDLLEKVRKLEVEIKEKDEQIALLKKTIEDKDNENKELKERIKELVEKASGSTSVENTPEYIKVCAERDVYIKLYNDLLNKK